MSHFTPTLDNYLPHRIQSPNIRQIRATSNTPMSIPTQAIQENTQNTNSLYSLLDPNLIGLCSVYITPRILSASKANHEEEENPQTKNPKSIKTEETPPEEEKINRQEDGNAHTEKEKSQEQHKHSESNGTNTESEFRNEKESKEKIKIDTNSEHEEKEARLEAEEKERQEAERLKKEEEHKRLEEEERRKQEEERLRQEDEKNDADSEYEEYKDAEVDKVESENEEDFESCNEEEEKKVQQEGGETPLEYDSKIEEETYTDPESVAERTDSDSFPDIESENEEYSESKEAEIDTDFKSDTDDTYSSNIFESEEVENFSSCKKEETDAGSESEEEENENDADSESEETEEKEEKSSQKTPLLNNFLKKLNLFIYRKKIANFFSRMWKKAPSSPEKNTSMPPKSSHTLSAHHTPNTYISPKRNQTIHYTSNDNYINYAYTPYFYNSNYYQGFNLHNKYHTNRDYSHYINRTHTSRFNNFSYYSGFDSWNQSYYTYSDLYNSIYNTAQEYELLQNIHKLSTSNTPSKTAISNTISKHDATKTNLNKTTQKETAQNTRPQDSYRLKSSIGYISTESDTSEKIRTRDEINLSKKEEIELKNYLSQSTINSSYSSQDKKEASKPKEKSTTRTKSEISGPENEKELTKTTIISYNEINQNLINKHLDFAENNTQNKKKLTSDIRIIRNIEYTDSDISKKFYQLIRSEIIKALQKMRQSGKNIHNDPDLTIEIPIAEIKEPFELNKKIYPKEYKINLIAKITHQNDFLCEVSSSDELFYNGKISMRVTKDEVYKEEYNQENNLTKKMPRTVHSLPFTHPNKILYAK